MLLYSLLFLGIIIQLRSLALGVVSCTSFPLFTAYLKQLGVRNAVTSSLVRSSPDRVVPVRALARDFQLCSWARLFSKYKKKIREV